MSLPRFLLKLSVLREAADLTQTELGRLVGTTQSNVARIEKACEEASNGGSWPTVNLDQISSWLACCGFDHVTPISFIRQLDATAEPHQWRAARAIEEWFHANGVAGSLRQKPLLAVVANAPTDHPGQSTLVRALLESGDRQFIGFYVPPPGSQVLWKHVSERPGNLSDSVFVVEGGVDLDAAAQRLALSTSGLIRSGGLTVAEPPASDADEAQADLSVIIYADHPLLRLCDVYQHPAITAKAPSAKIALTSLGLLSRATMTILCMYEQASYSASSVVQAAVTGRPWDAIAHPTSLDVRAAVEGIERSFSKTPLRMQMDSTGRINIGNDQALEELAALAIYHFMRASENLELVLARPHYPVGALTDRRSARRSAEHSLRDEAVMASAGLFDVDYPLTNDALIRALAAIRASDRPQFQSSSVRPVSAGDYQKQFQATSLRLQQALVAELADFSPALSSNALPQSARVAVQALLASQQKSRSG